MKIRKKTFQTIFKYWLNLNRNFKLTYRINSAENEIAFFTTIDKFYSPQTFFKKKHKNNFFYFCFKLNSDLAKPLTLKKCVKRAAASLFELRCQCFKSCVSTDLCGLCADWFTCEETLSDSWRKRDVLYECTMRSARCLCVILYSLLTAIASLCVVEFQSVGRSFDRSNKNSAAMKMNSEKRTTYTNRLA